MSRTYTLAVAQFEIPPFKYPHIHWALVAFLPGSRHATRYEVLGNTDTYQFDASATASLVSSTRLMGGAKVGEIPEENITNGWLERTLRRIPVVRGNPDWHCQAWIVDALRALGEHPREVQVTVGREAMVGWLRETMQEQWDLCELAEDHFFDCAMR